VTYARLHILTLVDYLQLY